MVFQLDDDLWFPRPEMANDDGLLAVGGDLSLERLLLAYQNGVFPWYGEDSPILWYSPHERFVIWPHEIVISKSMQKNIRTINWQIRYDHAFAEVIRACATVPRKEQDGTWINADMQEAYIRLHKAGFAHSVEVWEDGELAGGLYGVQVNGVFVGESMFSRKPNASKRALIALARRAGLKLIDCQLHNPHLESMGGRFISRESYLEILRNDRMSE